MRAAWLITLKDLRLRIRDRSAILVGFVVPFGLAAIFSTIFGDFGLGSVSFDFAVVNEDGGPVAEAFVDGVLPAIQESGVIAIDVVDDAEAARTATADGERDATIIIPAGFSADVAAGDAATMQVIGNVDATIGTQVAESIARSFAASLEAVQLSVAVVLSGDGPPDTGVADPAELAALVERASQLTSPVVLEEVEAETKQLDGTTYLSAGMAVFFLFFTVQFGVTGLLEERRDGTLDRLLAAPIPRLSVVLGKGLTAYLLGVVSMAVLIVGTALLLGAEWGNPVGVALLVLAGVLAAVAIMSVVATMARTAEQANVWQSIIAVTLGLLGGVFFPLTQGPGLLAKLSLITPHQWFLRGLGELQGGAGPPAVLPAVGAMIVFAAIGAAITAVRARREVLR